MYNLNNCTISNNTLIAKHITEQKIDHPYTTIDNIIKSNRIGGSLHVHKQLMGHMISDTKTKQLSVPKTIDELLDFVTPALTCV